MSHQNDWALLLGDDAPGYGHIIGERGGRILHNADPIAVLLQDPIDAFPARTIDESAVHENNCGKSGIELLAMTSLLRLVVFRCQIRRLSRSPWVTFYACLS